jgi:multidrug efflux pump subunit AcrA (membrane-fusion protein)
MISIVLILVAISVIVWRNFAPMTTQTQQLKEVYYCPMHPSYTSDRPGTCPICNMTLVKQKKAATEGHENMANENSQDANKQSGEYASLSLDLRQRQLLGIRTVAVKKMQLTKDIYAIGSVAHSNDLYKVQSEFIEAYQAYVNVYRDFRRIGTRRKNWEVHRQLQNKVLDAEHSLVMLGLGPAQIDKLRNVKWWKSWDQPELEIFKSNNNYWIFAQIFEQDIGFVEIGQKAVVEIPAFHETLNGVIRSVGGYIDPQTRTLRALIEVSGYRGELTANMLAYISIHSELGENLVVPDDAVTDLGTRKIVYVQKDKGIFDPVEINVGFQGEGYWAVNQGLKEGDQVVVSGNFLLDSESRLKAQLKDNSAHQTADQTQEVAHVHP